MNNRTKILTITHSSDLSGSTRSLLNLIGGTRNEIDWTVIYLKNKNDLLQSELKKLNVRYYSFFFRIDVFRKQSILKHNFFIFFIELVYNLLLAFRIALYAKRKKISFIHTNTSVTCLGAYISAISSIPHIWHFREFIDLDFNNRYKFGFPYLAYWANRAKKIVAVSNAVYEKAVRGRRIHADCVVIYNGVAFLKDIPKLRPKKIESPIRLSMVGFLDSAKNQLLAVKGVHLLLKKRYHVSLDIFGRCDGQYYEYYNLLKMYIQTNNLQNFIHFQGFNDDLKQLYSDAHISLMCSKNEAMGRVTVESMVNSTPVIGYDAAGTSELICNNISGVLFKGDEYDLCMAVERLANDDHLYSQIIIGGYNKAVKEFNVELYSKKFMEAIRSLQR